MACRDNYLVCVAEFVDLSRNQVSLVFLYINGVDVLLMVDKGKTFI